MSGPQATLAYGYTLGQDPVITATWYDEASGDGFTEQAEKHLLAALVGFTETDWWSYGYSNREEEAKAALGVQICSYGDGGGDARMYAIVARAITVEWGLPEVLDLPTLMGEPAKRGWDDRLAAALTALGITPTQKQPGWLLCPHHA